MKRCIITVVFTLLVCFGLVSTGFAASARYTDVPAQHWAADSIHRASELGIFQGVEQNVFGCGQEISRAAFVTALTRMFDWESSTSAKQTFSDVRPDAWYYSAVETAVANGAVAAVGTTFRPNEPLTRSEMVSMIVRALNYTSLAGTVSSGASPFSDVKANKGFITLGYDLGLIDGIGGGKFAPESVAKREHAAVLLLRVYDKLHTVSREVTAVGQSTAVSVKTPTASAGDELPTTPLEPITELYMELRRLKHSGQDMRRAVLCLTEGGVRTTQSNEGEILATDTVSAQEMQEILAQDGVRTYYSNRYESAYCVYVPNEYQKTTIWYQSEESLAVKLQLAKLFGVTKYYLQ
ncbi:MAG: S-layer homology domain-containing protein [Oscillospiraceae bacterium]|nr:S-layer homology domain-containing protein [Oscillospiraceae bacterium]